MKSICVFCGSSMGVRPEYEWATHKMGKSLVERHLRLVYGGGRVGLMGKLADVVLEAGGKVVGVIPRFLHDKEIAHQELTQLYIVDSMHERKFRMAELSDAFIALPGGYGTLEEVCEIITWAQLGLHHKPIGILNVANYYNPLLDFFNQAVAEGFIVPAALRHLVLDSESPEILLDLLEEYVPGSLL